jgi:hypothetical protein
MGIEPTSEAWEASILPLYDARSFLEFADYTQLSDCSYRPANFHIFQFHVGKRRSHLFEWNFSGVSCCHHSRAVPHLLAKNGRIDSG